MNSRAKGCVGEREAATFLRGIGFTARRGQQFAGGPDSPDVIVEELPSVHFEVKRDARVCFERNEFELAWQQAIEDARGRAVALLWRGNNQVWRLTFAATSPALRLTAHGDGDIRHALLWLQTDASNRGSEK